MYVSCQFVACIGACHSWYGESSGVVKGIVRRKHILVEKKMHRRKGMLRGSVPPAAPAGSCEARHAHHQVVGERRQARVSRTRAGGITEKGRLQGGHGKRCAAPGPGTNPTRHVLTLEPEAGAHAQTGRRQARVRTTRARGVRVNGLAPSIGAAECAGPAPESNLCRTALTCRPVAHAARRVSGGGRGLGARAGAAAG